MEKNKPLCSCCGEKVVYAKDLCSSCYMRSYRTGSTEYLRLHKETKKQIRKRNNENKRLENIKTFSNSTDERTIRFKKWYIEEHMSLGQIAERESKENQKISRNRVWQILKGLNK